MSACGRCGLSLPEGRLAACPRCLLAADESPACLGGEIDLIEEIGRGGMGVVWRARHRTLDRTVAVKLLTDERARDPDFLARFEREARALARLNHPNVVSLHDFARDGGRPYLVMEFVEGRPASELAPLPVDRVRDIARQVLDALEAAHAQGLVHRDIKPENLLVTPHGRVKLTDFGIARLTRPAGRGWTVTTPDVTVGTPHFLPPEIFAGAEPDTRMDLYSLGVTLHVLATGRLPVGSFDPAPAPLDRVIRRALAADPAVRFQTAAEFRAALDASPADLPPEELLWLRAVALLQSVSAAVAIWAFLLCISPRIVAPADLPALFNVGLETLADGRTVSRARFEILPVLAALVTFAAAITAFGFLRRHWRLAGLESPRPDERLQESRPVLAAAIAGLALYGLRLFVERGHVWAKPYITVLGGIILTSMLFFFWVAALQAWRRHRPLRREPALWAGLALALVPPATELFNYLRTWRP